MPQIDPLEVFVSYCHEDRELQSQLQKHLASLKREGVARLWFDGKITPGDPWEAEISDRLNAADIVLLLISSDFLASEFCWDQEMMRALARHDDGQVVVVPIIIRPCDWKTAPFAKLSVRPTGGRAVTTWSNIDAAFTDVAFGVRAVAEKLRASGGGGTGQTLGGDQEQPESLDDLSQDFLGQGEEPIEATARPSIGSPGEGEPAADLDRLSLLKEWFDSPDSIHNFIASEFYRQFYSEIDSNPRVYTDLAEKLACEGPHPWAEHFLLRGFREHYKKPSVRKELDSAIGRWISFVYPSGSVEPLAAGSEQSEDRTQAFYGRLGAEVEPGVFETSGFQLLVVDDPGLLRLGRLAVALMSLDPSSWIEVIAKGLVAEAVMDRPQKLELFAWVLRSSTESTWKSVEAEAKRLISDGRLPAKQAAFWLLSLQGASCASTLREEELDPEVLFTRPQGWEKLNDACMYRPWRLEDCVSCLQRTDIPIHILVYKMELWCAAPELKVPATFATRLVEEIEKLSPDELWQTLMRDHKLQMLEGPCCASVPGTYIRFIRSLVVFKDERTAQKLWRWTLEVLEHSLLLRPSENETIYGEWQRLAGDLELEQYERSAESFLFSLVLSKLSGAEQLAHLLRRAENARDLTRYERVFRPPTDTVGTVRLLEEAQSSSEAIRVLWHLSVNAAALPPEVVERASRFIAHENTLVRFSVLRLLYGAVSPVVTGALSGWSTSNNNSSVENHWGSLLLACRGRHLSFAELGERVDPAYLGLALEERGLVDEEVREYARRLDDFWEAIGAQSCRIATDFPKVKIEAPVDSNEPKLCLHAIQWEEPKWFGLEYFNPHFFWGRVPAGRDPPGEESPWEYPSRDLQNEKAEVVEREIERQRDLGNIWFYRLFFTNGLSEVSLQYPELVREWLGADPDRLMVASTFYEGLCGVLLLQDPENGVELYWRLKAEQLPVKVTSHGIERIDYFLFRAAATEKMCEVWDRRLLLCRTDKELLELVIVAEHGNGSSWLWKSCQRDLQRDLECLVVRDQARALFLLGLSSATAARDLLAEYVAQGPECWLGEVAQKALDYWRKNSWAQHWYSTFLTTAEDTDAYVAFRLLLKCADRRFWVWHSRLAQPSSSLPGAETRRLFFENNRDTLENLMLSNEKPFEDCLFGTKIEKGMGPWFG